MLPFFSFALLLAGVLSMKMRRALKLKGNIRSSNLTGVL